MTVELVQHILERLYMLCMFSWCVLKITNHSRWHIYLCMQSTGGGKGRDVVMSPSQICKPTTKVASNMTILLPMQTVNVRIITIFLFLLDVAHTTIQFESNIDFVWFVYAPKRYGPKGSWWICTIPMTYNKKWPSVV